MPSKSFNENSENKTSLSRRTFVVGSGVEPLAHYCSGNCSTVNLKNSWATTTILKNYHRDFKPFGVVIMLLSLQVHFYCPPDFYTKIRTFFWIVKSFFFEFRYRVSFITYKFQTHYKVKKIILFRQIFSFFLIIINTNIGLFIW